MKRFMNKVQLQNGDGSFWFSNSVAIFQSRILAFSLHAGVQTLRHQLKVGMSGGHSTSRC